MKKFMTMVCAGVLALGLGLQDAEAKRLGGGSSRGMQRDTVTQKQATPQQPAQQQQVAPAQQAAHNPAAAPVPQPQKRSWLGPLAGLAAGIGLAALLSHFGMGEGVANFLMILLAVVGAVLLFKFLFRRSQPQPAREPLQYAGVGGPNLAPLPQSHFEPAGGVSGMAAPLAAATSPNIPADFDIPGFLRIAKVNFLRLQGANDTGKIDDLREFLTPEMLAEVKLDLDERRGATQHTDVQNLEAELLEVVTEGGRHIASVRFHGLIREEQNGPVEHFDEVWNLVKPADGSQGWKVAGIQQLN